MGTPLRTTFLAAAVFLMPGVALAYGGLGSMISGIGAFRAAVGAI
jgi:hypothetical protein